MDNRMIMQKNAATLKKEMKGKLYRHFKGGLYRVIDIGVHSEDENLLVIYQSESDHNLVWVRPYDMFMSKVDKKKYPDVKQEYRFEQVEE